MTPVQTVLDRLDAVRSTGPGSWMARCPAHEDHRPSLSIREGDDGRVLLYDFAGCGAAEVVAALGLDLRDLFPPREPTTYPDPKKTRRPRGGARRIPAADALRVLDHEALVVELVADRLLRGEDLGEHRNTLATAAQRIACIRHAWEVQP